MSTEATLRLHAGISSRHLPAALFSQIKLWSAGIGDTKAAALPQPLQALILPVRTLKQLLTPLIGIR